VWDSRIVVSARECRKDMKDPHAAAMWDSRSPGRGLGSRKDLKDPHAAAVWDSGIAWECS